MIKVVTEKYDNGNIKKEPGLCSSCALPYGIAFKPRKVETNQGNGVPADTGYVSPRFIPTVVVA
jgi:hypothetical protein